MRLVLCSLTAAFLVFASHARAAEPNAAGLELFEKKIRPALVQHCYACHSVEAQKAKKLRGDLLLDSRAGLLKGGVNGPIIVPGKPQDSELILALRHTDVRKMPPKTKLPDDLIADFTRWVQLGAPDPRDGNVVAAKMIDVEAGRKFWSFRPLTDSAPPQVKNQPWVRTPVDRFILAKLEEKGLTPNTVAGRQTLIRRAYYDLLGLPPSPADIDAFVKDNSPDAYERLIDRLLASERYGERWARHWLDGVRYAESGGYEFDKDRPGAHHYRDFVIKSLNQDMPYDQFVRLQLAGDHLAPNDPFSVSATGFLVAGPYPGQTTAKTLQLIRYNHLDDMLSTVGTSMLGLSLGCARCHDHKFDPIPQKDYYRLLANLARTDSADVRIDVNAEATRKAKAEFDKDHAPLVAARERFEKEELASRVEKWLAANKDKERAKWVILDAAPTAPKTTFNKLNDGSYLANGKGGKNESYTFSIQTYQRGIKALRLEALAEASLPKTGPGRGPDGNFFVSEVSLTAAPLTGKTKPVAVKLRAVAQPGQALAGVLDADKKTGWVGAVGKDQAALFESETDLGFEGGTMLTLTVKFENDGFGIGRPRLSLTTAARPATLDGTSGPQNVQELLALLLAEKGQVTAKNREGVARWYRTFDAEADKIYAAVEQHTKKEPQPKLVSVFAATSGKGGDVNFLIRGEVERKGEVMKPGYVQVLTTGSDQRWEASTTPRVGLAKWVTDTDYGAGQLLARVIVNRLWQHHLGRGIVGTPNDFGAQGDLPSHPELLDWLARELIRGEWKLKPLHKLLMTSSVYMQTGDVNAANLKADPQNALWWRRPARRLEAEAIRDALLAVSGTLDTTMYGPGSLDANTSRRSVYLTVKRSQMIPMMQMFDAPEAIQSIGERPTTTVPTQSLAFLNSPFVRQRAEKLAQRVKPKANEPLTHAIEEGYRAALGRRPTDAERERGVSFVERQTEKYGRTAKASDQALTDFCQLLLCLNEFVYVD